MENINPAVCLGLSMRKQHLYLGRMLCSTAFAAEMYFQPLLRVDLPCERTCTNYVVISWLSFSCT